MEFPRRDLSGVDIVSVPKQYMSENLHMVQKSLEDNDPSILKKLVRDKRIDDSEEAILVMYTAMMMNLPDIFNGILEKNKFFRFKPDWHALFV